MSIDSNGVVTNEALARYDAGIKDIIAMRTAEKNPVRYKVVKSTSTGSQTYSFYKKDENDTDFVVDSASDAITVQDSIDSTSKDPVNGVAVAAKFAEQMTTQNINSIIGYTPMDSSLKGAANGVASLDGLGQVPTSQLPLADSYSPTGTKPVTGTVVAAALATLPEPMVFKGTVGTGGTVTSLPAAANSNKGHTYKAISGNIVSGSKIGDTFISTGSAWVTIPSGDEPSGTVTQVGINASSGSHLSASGTVTSSGNLTVGVESGYQIPSSSDVSQITTNKTNILYAMQNGVKNVLPFTAPSMTDDNVTFTRNSDGSITVNSNGAISANKNLAFFEGKMSDIVKETGDYVLYGNSSNSRVKMWFYYTDNWSGVFDPSTSETDTYIIHSITKSDRPVIVRVKVESGTALSNVTIYPMICTKAAWDQEPNVYRPFALPNYDLTRLEAEDRASLAEVVDSGAKNKFQITLASTTGYTVNSDGTVTASGALSNSEFNMGNFLTGTLSNLVLSGCSGGSNSTYCLLFQYRISGGNVQAIRQYDDPVVINLTNVTWSALYVEVKSLSVGQTKVFKPMLCTKAAFGVSNKFVPYRPNYDLVCNKLNTIGLRKMVSYNASAANTYEVLSNSKITIPTGKYLRMTATGIWRNTYITGIRIQRGNDVENGHTLAINESSTGYNGLPVTTTFYNDTASSVDIYVAAKAEGTSNTMIAIVYDLV